MKIKTLLVAVMALLVSVAAYARDTYSTNVEDLPQAARTLLTTHFPNVQVNHIKIDSHVLGGKDYDVVLNNGTEIDFDSEGRLDEIDCGRNGKVPDALVFAPILQYVHNTYPGQKIIKYDVKRSGYEVELNNGLDLVFNKQGNFLHLDD